jgi:hypothetical protein
MDSSVIPTAEEIRARLEPLSRGQLIEIAERSGVPFGTLWKIRIGGDSTGKHGTDNPGIATVRKFAPYLPD